MGFIDFLTLVLILAAGFQVGIQATFAADVAGWIFGGGEKILFEMMGASAVWQLFRQRYY
jgi:uncharacterized membrane protein YuzA (DUF378 family)